MADFPQYDRFDSEDEIPDEDYYDDIGDDKLDELLEDAEDGDELTFLELDDEFDTKDEDIESKRWNKRPKKGYREEDE